MKLTFVIPAYNEEKTIEPLVEGIVKYSTPHDIQIILIDDGSTDQTFSVMKNTQEKYPQVEIIKLRKNFGKSRALSAGFSKAVGDIVITMDADLQDDPKEIPRMIEKIEEGYDVVCGWKKNRLDPWHKTFPSKVYNGIVRTIFKVKLHDINTGFKAFRKEVIQNISLYGEMHRLIAILASEMGFKVTEIPVEHHPRKYGKSKFGINRFFHGIVDVYTVWFLSRHGQSPLYLFTSNGLALIAVGILLFLEGLCLPLFSGPILVIIGIILFCYGDLIIGVGLIAEMLRKEFSLKQQDNFLVELTIPGQKQDTK
ncbi:MAG TPA: glycosyltransferase family 2 protein [Candidatus Hydrogenedens sp.]|nr:glycosyltransferase family 2 protein [Candidatus Hydrogenedens sp.]